MLNLFIKKSTFHPITMGKKNGGSPKIKKMMQQLHYLGIYLKEMKTVGA